MLKSAHYAAIHLLFKNGHSKRAIAHLTSHDRKTVDKVLRTEARLSLFNGVSESINWTLFASHWSSNSRQEA
jgi:hypothetical protein